MPHQARMGLFVAAAVAVAAPATLGGEDADEARPSVDELIERIEQLEDDKGRMRDEIDELRTQVGDNWLTEQRADEIRNLVADVLADADTRASMLQSGLTAGWDEHFFLASTDDRFRLQLDGMLQTRFIWNYHDQEPNQQWGFENTRTKLTFRGHVFGPDITYLVRSDFRRTAGANVLQDAWIRYHLNDEFSLRVGQFKLPFNREELVGPQYQQAVERSLVNENLNIGRSQGVELLYTSRSVRFAFMYSDGGVDNFGGFGLVGASPPPNSPWSAADTGFAFTARLENLVAGSWNQFTQFTSPPGDPYALMWGIAAHWQQTRFNGLPSFGRNETPWVTATADVSAQFGGADLFSSLTWSYIDHPNFGQFNIWGWVLQGGTYF
ncbi:MAG: porin, partial [Planctomycetota bacterium]